MERFTGKVALITGAASGIGRAVTLRLTSEGGQVLAHDLNAAGVEETAKLAADAGGAVEVRAGDVSDPEECQAAVEACVSAYGRLDVLGNVAGIARGEHMADVSVAGYRQMMGVNVDGPFFLAQAALPHLLESGGTIVNIASNAGLMGQAYTVVYCMTKGAVVQLTRALAMELMKTPVRVNADVDHAVGHRLGPHGALLRHAGHEQRRGGGERVRLPGLRRGLEHPRCHHQRRPRRHDWLETFKL